MTEKKSKEKADEAEPEEVFPQLLQLPPSVIYSCQRCPDFVPYRVQKTEGACDGLCAHPEASANAWSVLGEDLQTPEDICPRLKETPDRPPSASLSRRLEALLALGQAIFDLESVEDDGSTEFLRVFYQRVLTEIKKAQKKMS